MPIIIGKPSSSDGGAGNPSPDQEARFASIESINTQQTSAINTANTRIDGVVSDTSSFAERVTTLENSFVDYAPTIQTIQAKDVDQDGLITLANGKNDEQDVKLAALESTSTAYNTRMNTIESSLPNKADLVSGKIPMAQLPDLPVGRKVSVADDAARLALPVHPDLTIAYQIDTADAWVLDSSEDPSVEANWDKLGNAQATGVESFKGRTGNVTPTTGDYTSAQITISSDRAFISDADRVRWDNKPSPASVEASVSGLRTEVAAAYVKTTSLAANNGVATLGSDGKVPTAQLPPLGLTTTQSQRIDQIESNTNLANVKGDIAATNSLALDSRITQVETDSKSRDTAQTTRLTALEARPTGNYIPIAQKAAANGVASLAADSKVPLTQLPATVGGSAIHANTMVLLDANGKLGNALVYRDVVSGLCPLDVNRKVPVANLITNTANGIAGLGADGKVAAAQLPDPPVQAWVNPAGRAVGTWYTNNTKNVMFLNLRTASSTSASRFLNVQTRATSGSTAFHQRSTAISATTDRWIQLLAVVPPGWQYMVDTFGGSTTANTEYWHEMS